MKLIRDPLTLILIGLLALNTSCDILNGDSGTDYLCEKGSRTG